MLRKPGAKGDFVRGRSGQFPFTPGGLDGISEDIDTGPSFRIDEKTTIGPLSSVPPGFTRGLRLKLAQEELDLENTEIEDNGDTREVVRSVHFSTADSSQRTEAQTGFEAIDDLLPDEV